MVTAAARLTPQLVRALARLDDGSLPIAELARRVARLAEASGRTRPSYERIRQLVHLLRQARRRPAVILGTRSAACVRLGPVRIRVGSLVSLELQRQRDGPARPPRSERQATTRASARARRDRRPPGPDRRRARRS